MGYGEQETYHSRHDRGTNVVPTAVLREQHVAADVSCRGRTIDTQCTGQIKSAQATIAGCGAKAYCYRIE